MALCNITETFNVIQCRKVVQGTRRVTAEYVCMLSGLE